MRMKNEEAWESQSSNDESLVTKNVFINGKMEERVIALPKNYLMEQPKDKGKLLGSLDKEKLLGVTYNFTNPQRQTKTVIIIHNIHKPTKQLAIFHNNAF